MFRDFFSNYFSHTLLSPETSLMDIGDLLIVHSLRDSVHVSLSLFSVVQNREFSLLHPPFTDSEFPHLCCTRVSLWQVCEVQLLCFSIL